MGLLNLEEQYAFYGAYHSNPVNVAIHVIFVWPILFTALILCCYTPSLLPPVVVSGNEVVAFNLAFFVAIGYAVYYVILDRRAGSVAAALLLACLLGANASYHALGVALAWKVALAVNVCCWIGQFLGHGIFEGRSPALLDNLAQAFLMAPFFVLLEILERVFHYEPTPGFQLRVRTKVDEAIKEFRAKKQA